MTIMITDKESFLRSIYGHSINDVIHWEPDKERVKFVRENMRGYYWNFDVLTLHPSFTIEDILENPDLPWEIKLLHRRVDFDLSILDDTPTRHWNWFEIQKKYNVSVWDYVLKYEHLGWDWSYLTRFHSGNVRWDIIQKYKRMNWDWKMLLGFSKPDEFEQLYECMPEPCTTFFCTHNIVDWKFIDKHPNLPWDFNELSKNDKNIDWKFIENHPFLPWNFKEISKNDKITNNWETVIQKYSVPWDYKILSKHKNVRWSCVVQMQDKKWDWKLLSHAQYINWYAVVICKEKEWNFKHLSSRTDLCWTILPYTRHLWNWGRLSKNPVIPSEFREKYWYLPWRRYGYERRLKAVLLIQKWWSSLPFTLSCKKRNH